MRAETTSRVTAWETRPFDGGYAGLDALSATGFSGGVHADDAWLFMLNGRAIGLFDGSIEAFAGASATAYAAPHPALPILFAMREQGGETRAKYYTNDTPLDEVAETLSSGGFTGYVELSENVMSGAYYLVYHQGRSMSVAFVGGQGRLLTDEDARKRAIEEVGVYEVTAVEIEEIELPDPPTDTPATTSPDPTREPADEPTAEPASEEPQSSTAESSEPADPAAPAGAEAATDPDPDHAGTSTVENERSTVENERSTADVETPDDVEIPDDVQPADADADRNAEPEPATADEPTDPTDRWGSVVENTVDQRFAAEQQWQKTARIPSLDPERSAEPATGTATATREDPSESDQASVPATPEPRSADSRPVAEELRAERQARETAQQEADRLREEVASLRDRIEELEASDTASASESDSAPEPDTRESLSPARALSGTTLFVRYASKGRPTLEAAHAGEADREAVDENLRLERHTDFAADAVAVDGRPFEEFLQDRIEYRFADWFVREFPFELRDTGHAGDLDALYDVLPRIDRIDLDGSIAVGEDDRTFDIVVRDRMGEPLLVADCTDGRDPIGEEPIASLVTAATETKADAADLAGAMLVTTSFFDGAALETATEATRSGLLDRGSQKSYVTISRRSGYHLCLIELRDGTFHVQMPDL